MLKRYRQTGHLIAVIEIDRDHDLAYIHLRPEMHDRPGRAARSIQASEDIVLDVDAKGRLIGIELLNASSRLDLSRVSEGPARLIVGVKEAAEMLGVEKSNFVRDHASRSEFPRPVAELASGRLWLRSDVQRYLLRRRGRVTRRPAASKTGQVRRGRAR